MIEDTDWMKSLSQRLGEKKMLDHDVLAHFGLREDPFAMEITDSRGLFRGANYLRLAKQVERAARMKGFAAVIGEVGAGKTMTRKLVEERLRASKKVTFRLLVPPSPSRESMLARNLEESIIRDLAPGSTVRQGIDARARQLKRLLAEAAEREELCVLLIDEAHALPNNTLRSLKRFLELADGFDRLLGIILFGQPELENLLDDSRLREVSQRCSRLPITGLAKAEVGPYLEHRLSLVGARRVIFDESAAKALTRRGSIAGHKYDRFRSVSRVPLALGNIAGRAMDAAFDTASRLVKGAHIEEAFGER